MFSFALLVGCNITREQVQAVETKITQARQVIKEGGEYAKASLELIKLLKDQSPKLKELFPQLAAFLDKLAPTLDVLSAKGQVVIDAANKADVVLGQVTDILSEVKGAIPGGVDSEGKPITVPWYSLIIGLVLGGGKKLLGVA